jgi:hypothetical protein
MPGLAPVTLRQHVQNGILAALLAESWQLARTVYDRFPGDDPANIDALAFAVGLPSSDMLGGRQPTGGQAPANTVVGVKFTYIIRPDYQVGDYDLALERETRLAGVVNGLVGLPRSYLAGIVRQVVADGTVFVADLRFVVFHGYPLRGA